jgi:hypothetical protein
MNGAEAVHFHLQTLIARGLGSPAIAAEVGITGASEIWGGIEPRDHPGWYLWLRDRRGAYALELDGADRVERRGTHLDRGRLAIRYFPSPAEAEFASFSPEERALIASGWVDASGAPEILRAHEAPPRFFVVGALEVVLRDVGDTFALALCTVDRLRWSYAEDWTGTSPPLGTVRRRRGERTRDVPGWSVSWPLLAALGGLVAQGERRPAVRLVEARQPGFALVHRGGAFVQEDVEDVSHRELLVLFAGAGAAPDPDPAHGLVDDAATIVGDVPLARDGRAAQGSAPHAGARDRPAVAAPACWFPRGPAPARRADCAC